MENTSRQFDAALGRCRDIYIKKNQDYGPSWRTMRPSTLTDQLFIKAKRIRTLDSGEEAMVDEPILPEFLAIVNYGLMALLQLELPSTIVPDLTSEEATRLYDEKVAEVKALMLAKNHDYGEAWREMRVSSFTDIILSKLLRIKQIEDNAGQTLISEGADSNYMDIINYAVFAIISLS